MRGYSLGVATAALLSTVSAANLDPIVMKGSKLFYKTNGTEFFMKGVAYQEDFNGAVSSDTSSSAQYNDPLTNPTACARDIPLMQALGINTIRVYAIDTSKDHTACMTALNNAGIYVVADLSEPQISINRDEPQWDLALYERYTGVVDVMQNWTNVVAFFAGNEVTNNLTNTDASPYVKAAVRDMKSYIKSKGYRSILVGYASNDDSDIRGPIADYFNCGPQSAAIDIFGYNIYSWCDPSDYITSGWVDRTEEYRNYSVPVVFAEYGCNKQRPRTWGEVNALYGSNMTQVFSGGIVYMWFEEENMYGLVQVGSNNQATLLPDYTNLKKVLPVVDPTGVQASAYSPSNSPRACPAQSAEWSASTVLPPTPDSGLCSCMVASLECVANNVDTDSYAETFGYICDKVKSQCAGISGNGTTGKYGAYSGCSAEQRLSWAMNDYYQQNKNQGTAACDFNGLAKTQSASASSKCKDQVDNVGGLAGGSPATGTSDGNSTTSSNPAAPMVIPSMSLTAISMIGMTFAAFFGGVGMIIL